MTNREAIEVLNNWDMACPICEKRKSEEKGVCVDCRFNKALNLAIKALCDQISNRAKVIFADGTSAYLTQGHIDCLLEYEKQLNVKAAVACVFDSWDSGKGMQVDGTDVILDQIKKIAFYNNYTDSLKILMIKDIFSGEAEE